MFRNSNSSTPFIILIAVAALIALVGLVTGLGDFNARQQAVPTAAPAPVSDSTDTVVQNDTRPYSPPLAQPQNTLTVALSGEMANGGYWSWDDIVNLLGVYGTAGQFQTATVDGTSYNGVPLSYLLSYARINGETDRLVLTNRQGRQYMYALNSVNAFSDYLIAAANNTLVVVPPSRQNLHMINNLVTIQALQQEDTALVQAVAIPANPTTLELSGEIERGGIWTWTDLTNLLAAYTTDGAYRTVATGNATYSGVPISYLIDYARVTRDRVNRVFLYNRSGTEYAAGAGLPGCLDCIIARSNNGTLLLVRPGQEPEVIFELAVIHIP